MGNNCCAGRQKIEESPHKKKRKQRRLTQANPRDIQSAILPLFEAQTPVWMPMNRLKTYSGISNIPELPIRQENSQSLADSESSDYLIEYSLTSISKISETQQKNILELLNFYKYGVTEGYEEVDSLLEATLHINDENVEEIVLIITTKSIYIVNPSSFNQCRRKVSIEDVLIACVDKSVTSGILHTKKSVIEGDLWITSPKLEDFIFGLQNIYMALIAHYFPTYSASKNELPSKFNNLSFALVSAYENSILVQINDVLVSEGIIGENIVYLKEAFYYNENAQCYALLTNENFYIIHIDFKLLFEKQINKILSLAHTDSSSQIIIRTIETDILIEVPVKFILMLEDLYKENSENLNLHIEKFKHEEFQELLKSLNI